MAGQHSGHLSSGPSSRQEVACIAVELTTAILYEYCMTIILLQNDTAHTGAQSFSNIFFFFFLTEVDLKINYNHDGSFDMQVTGSMY